MFVLRLNLKKGLQTFSLAPHFPLDKLQIEIQQFCYSDQNKNTFLIKRLKK